MAGISPWQLLIVLLIVLVIFGTKKLRNVGGDLGSAIKDFRKGVGEGDKDDSAEDKNDSMKAERSDSESKS